MGSFSIWHWLVVGILVLLLFGKGRFSEMMGDVAKGIKSLPKGMTEEDEPRGTSTDRRVEALDSPRTVSVEKDKSEERL